MTGTPPGSRAAPEPDLLALAYPGGVPAGARGLFRDDSAIRRISAENALIFGGGCALLLEVAHPLVAAGVARHSNFRTDPMGRLQRTLEAMNQIVFGDLDAALEAARRVRRVHASVRGRLDFEAGPFASSSTYDGRDPELVRWVWASLVWTSLRVTDQFLEPVSEEDRRDFYADQCVVARILGTPPALLPVDHRAFQRYFDDLVESPVLAITDEARAIAAFILDPPGGTVGGGLVRVVTTALLPPRLRDAFGLGWDESDAAQLQSLSGQIRALRSRPQPGSAG